VSQKEEIFQISKHR